MKRNNAGRFTGCTYAIWEYEANRFALLRFASAEDRDGFIAREQGRMIYDSYLPVSTRKASRYFDLRHFDDPCGQRYFELDPRICPAPSGRIVYGIETREALSFDRAKELRAIMRDAWTARDDED